MKSKAGYFPVTNSPLINGESTNCPQCGSAGYTDGVECGVCGFNAADQAEITQTVQKPMASPKRDVMNGFGLGCSVMCFVWLFAWSIIIALAAHIHRTSAYGPAIGNAVPIVVVVALYLMLRRKPSAFSKGVGYSLLITLVIALAFAYIGTRFHDIRPPANGAGNGFE